MLDCQSCHKFRRHFLGELICNEYEYRELDGSNNNSKHPSYGKAGQNFIRHSESDYQDGLNSPSGNNRPSTRVVSNLVFDQEESKPNPQGITNMFWLYGQLVDHSITLTNTGDVKWPIQVPKGDEYFDPEGTGDKTISFTRSIYDPETGKNGKPREQINQLTPLLDASMVYGHNKKRGDYLRTFKDGLMRTSQGNMLPIYTGGFPNAGPPSYVSFIAGDVRSNEHIGLTSMHNLFVIEHNFWAKEIKKCAPNMSDENIYQKAKMVVEAEIQAIAYNEYLPLLLGSKGLSKYKGFDSEVDPQLTNEFAAAAYRFGHSMVATDMYEGKINLRDTFFASHIISNGEGIGPILEQFCNSQSETLNSKMINDLRNFLFGEPGKGGHDLAALNMQRGRDHGLASYNQVRKDLGLSIQERRKDMDLFCGGLLECRHSKALVGETFYLLIKDQFERIRTGDSFWYQRRMSKKQVKYINGITLGQIMYRHTGFDRNDVFSKSNNKYKCKCHK